MYMYAALLAPHPKVVSAASKRSPLAKAPVAPLNVTLEWRASTVAAGASQTSMST